MTKTNIRILSFAAALMLVGAGFFLAGISERNKLRREIAAAHSRAFSELASHACAINSLLGELGELEEIKFGELVPGQTAAVCADLVARAALARANLSCLPVWGGTTPLYEFFEQAGTFGYAVLRGSLPIPPNPPHADNADMSDAVGKLADYSGRLAGQLAALCDGISRANALAALGCAEYIGALEAAGVLEPLEQFELLDLLELPAPETPETESAGNHAAAREISAAAALDKAAQALKVSATRVKARGLTQPGRPDMPGGAAFNFEADGRFIQIAQNGGHILNYFADRRVSGQLISDEDALLAAEKFLREKAGLDCGELVAARKSGGVLAFDFRAGTGQAQQAQKDSAGAIKIGVALDSGEVIFYSAGGRT